MANRILHLPDPFGNGNDSNDKDITPPPAVAPMEVTFDKGYEGPSASDMPSIPKPIARVSTTKPVNEPSIKPVAVDMVSGINYLAEMVSLFAVRPGSFTTGHITCANANVGYQLPQFVVPLFKQVIVKAWYTNVGVIYIAYRQSDSQNTAVGWPLIANEGVGYDIPNTNGIWVMSTVAGEGVSFTVEQY